ncbi:MAG: hypothetical protein V7L05_12655 [Nostoc sp.]
MRGMREMREIAPTETLLRHRSVQVSTSAQCPMLKDENKDLQK